MTHELESLSYFFGAWLGDGYTVSNINSLRTGVSCAEPEIVVYSMLCTLKYSSKLKPTFRCTATKNQVTIYIATWHGVEFSKLIRSSTDNKQKLPEYIWSTSREFQLEMLAGIMDTDGSIIKHTNTTYRLELSGTKQFVLEVPILFACVGIPTNKVAIKKPKKGSEVWRFSIPTYEAVLNGFYFRCLRKQERLKAYMLRNDIVPYDAPDIIGAMENE